MKKVAVVTGAHAKPLLFMSTFFLDRFNDWFMGAITKTLLKRRWRKSAAQGA